MTKVIRILALAAVLLVGGNLCAQTVWQDVVYCKNGAVIKGTIIEQIPNETIKIQTADGNIFVYKMSEVERMSKEQMQTPKAKSGTGSLESSDDMCYRGKEDAKANYQGKGSLSGATWAVNILASPVLGLIPAAIGASSDLDDSQMNYPSRELWNNRDYKDCYTQEAMNKKSKKSWNAYLASAGVWAGVTALINVLIYSLY